MAERLQAKVLAKRLLEDAMARGFTARMDFDDGGVYVHAFIPIDGR